MTNQITNQKIITTLRDMEWERAKGSILAILSSYWPHEITPEEYDQLVEAFEQLKRSFREIAGLE